MLTRRQLLQQSALLGGALVSFPDLLAEFNKRKFKIGACDWSIGKDSDVAVFDIAKEIGLQGVMVNMGSEKNNLHLRQRELQQQYTEASKRTGVKISSLAIGELNKTPYKSDPKTEEWVWDSIDVAKNLQVPVILLAFFSKNDLRNDDAGKKEVIARLKKVAPKAEKMNVILGIESYLSAGEHLDIIEKVGSKNVKVYYDFRNTADAGHDVYSDVQKIGKDLICELHMKENRVPLGEGTLDWPRIAGILKDMGYYGDGWMQIEWAKRDEEEVLTAYKKNLQFLKKVFI
jgi:L-ribulose-5-phosphate 3-epimerase